MSDNHLSPAFNGATARSPLRVGDAGLSLEYNVFILN
jgi:hypothetical protein